MIVSYSNLFIERVEESECKSLYKYYYKMFEKRLIVESNILGIYRFQ